MDSHNRIGQGDRKQNENDILMSVEYQVPSEATILKCCSVKQICRLLFCIE